MVTDAASCADVVLNGIFELGVAGVVVNPYHSIHELQCPVAAPTAAQTIAVRRLST
jgi:hypothetical protein